jgi:hypothetical protein
MITPADITLRDIGSAVKDLSLKIEADSKNESTIKRMLLIIKQKPPAKDIITQENILSDIQEKIERHLSELIIGPDCPSHEDIVIKHINTILRIANYDARIKPEQINFAGKRYEPDILVYPQKIVIEGKVCRTPEDQSRIVEEMSSDLKAYKDNYPFVFFVIFECKRLRDRESLITDFEKAGCIVIVVPARFI